jgi:hypothetical protein
VACWCSGISPLLSLSPGRVEIWTSKGHCHATCIRVLAALSAAVPHTENHLGGPDAMAEFYGSLPDKYFRDLKDMPPLPRSESVTGTEFAFCYRLAIMPNRHDKLTIISMAVVASASATLLHEGVGHGLTAWLRGDIPTELTSNHLSSVRPDRWVDAGGTLVNLLIGASSLLSSRVAGHRANVRYFFWIFAAFNLLHAAGYFLFSGISGFGDWQEVIRGLPHPVALRIGMTVFGAVMYFWPYGFSPCRYGPSYRIGERTISWAGSHTVRRPFSVVRQVRLTLLGLSFSWYRPFRRHSVDRRASCGPTVYCRAQPRGGHCSCVVRSRGGLPRPYLEARISLSLVEVYSSPCQAEDSPSSPRVVTRVLSEGSRQASYRQSRFWELRLAWTKPL